MRSLTLVFLTLIRYYGHLTLWTIFLGNGGVHIDETCLYTKDLSTRARGQLLVGMTEVSVSNGGKRREFQLNWHPRFLWLAYTQTYKKAPSARFAYYFLRNPEETKVLMKLRRALSLHPLRCGEDKHT